MSRIVALGVACWVAAGVATLLVPAWHTADHWWWPWTCGVGALLGIVGYVYIRRGRGNAAGAS